MSKDYPFPLWVNDFFKDTDHLTRVEKSSYVFLLMHRWKHGGTLPDDDQMLARLAMLDLRTWAKIKPQITPFLERFGEPGSYRWTQKRLLKELGYVVQISQKQANKAARSN